MEAPQLVGFPSTWSTYRSAVGSDIKCHIGTTDAQDVDSRSIYIGNVRIAKKYTIRLTLFHNLLFCLCRLTMVLRLKNCRPIFNLVAPSTV